MKVREMRHQVRKLYSEGKISESGAKPSAVGGTIAMLNKEQCEEILRTGSIGWDDLKSAVEKREGYMHQKRVGAGSKPTPAERQGERQVDSEGNTTTFKTLIPDEPNRISKITKNKDGKVLGSIEVDRRDLTEEQIKSIDKSSKKCETTTKVPKIIELPKGDDELKFFTTKDSKSIEEVQEMVGAKMLAKEVESLKESRTIMTDSILHNTKSLKTEGEIRRENHSMMVNRIDELKKKIEENQGGDINIISHEPKNIKLKDEHYHPQFRNIVQMLPIAKQLMLVGDAGTGKTFVANQVADALELQFKHISCSGGMSEGMLIGKMLFDGTFVSTDFLDCYENGGVFLLDEMDSADANLLVVLNSALANGYLSVPNRKDNPTAKRHDDFLLIACCNTFGTGNGSRVYAGRNRLDGATLDRFYTIDFDYDRKLETKLSGNQEEMKKAVWRLRDEVKRQRLDKVVSTRWIQQGQMTLDNTDKTLGEFLKEKTLSWTDAEKKKCDVDGIIEGAK